MILFAGASGITTALLAILASVVAFYVGQRSTETETGTGTETEPKPTPATTEEGEGT